LTFARIHASSGFLQGGSMSRVPAPDWLRVAEPVKSVESFADKLAVASQSMKQPAAALTALHYEAVAVIERLAVLVDRGGNSILIDKAAQSLQRWNNAVREAGVLVKSV
jgi:hypothetical protein